MSYRSHVDGVFTLDRPLTVEHKVTLDKFATERHEGSRFPGYPYCQWVPIEDGTGIQYTEDDVSSYVMEEWLAYLVKTFLAPWGYVLNGRADYTGEEPGDVGAIFVRDNVVKAVDAQIVIPDPFQDGAS